MSKGDIFRTAALFTVAILSPWEMVYFPRRARRITAARTQEPRANPILRARRTARRPPPRPPAADAAERTGCAALGWRVGARRPCVLRLPREERVVYYAMSREDGEPISPHFGILIPLVYFIPGLIYGVSFAPVFLLAQNPPACVLAIKVRYQVPPCGHMLCATCADRSENDRVSRK